MNATASTGERAGRKEWIGLAVLALPTILLALDMSVLYLALPHLAQDLGATSVQQLWITDIYGFLVAGLLITMGNVGDRIGRRKLLLIGAAVFAVASAAAAWSNSAEMLIITRALMGVAGATLMPSTLALISNMFKDPKQNAAAIGVWMGAFMGGIALGPIVGGVMLEFFWWGSVFLLALPVMALLLFSAPRLLPEFKNPNSEGTSLDFVSVGMSLATILPVVYGLKELTREGVQFLDIAAIVVGLVVGWLFVRRQHTLEHPLLDPKLFHNKTFSAAVTIGIGAGIMAGTNLFVYQYLQTVDELSPLSTALWMLPSTLVTVVSLQIAPMLARRIKPGIVIAGGLVIVAIGYFMLTQLGSGDLGLLIAGLIVSAIGIGPVAGLGATLVLGSVPPEEAGVASAVNETGAEFGIAMGVATMGVIGTAVYRANFDGEVGPGLPGEVVEAAKESIAGALVAAQNLTGPLQGQLLNGAREAFSYSLNATALASGFVALALSAVAVAFLRGTPPSAEVEAAMAEQAEQEKADDDAAAEVSLAD